MFWCFVARQDIGARPEIWAWPTGDGLVVPAGGQVGGPVAPHPLPRGWASHAVILGGRGCSQSPSPFLFLHPPPRWSWGQVHTWAGPYRPRP